MIGVHASAIGAKRHLLEAILEPQEAVHEDVWNVATSPRHDVPTSRRWVNYYAGQQAATSRRLNVATSVRVLFSHHLKANRGQNWRYRETYRLGGGNQSSSDIDLEEKPVICIVSSFLTIERMFYISRISILLVSMF